MKNRMYLKTNCSRRRFAVEPLERRIAPAVKALTFAATFTPIANGFANVLSAGDVGYFEDGNAAGQAADGTEPSLIKVTGGKALVFLSDLNSDGRFEPNEITGLALSNGAKVEAFFGINGPVVTNVDADGTLSDGSSGPNSGEKLVPASIAGLTVHGNISGIVAAGLNISNVNVQGTIGSSNTVSGVFTGHAVDRITQSDDVTFNFGAHQPLPITMDAYVAPANAANGGDITNLTAYGLLGNQADGPTIATGEGEAGARGGNVKGVSLLHQSSAYQVIAGDGGSSLTGAGGAGGSILSFAQSNGTGPGALTAGTGGEGVTAGGAGGSINGVTVTNVTGTYTLSGGSGAIGTTAGGSGGVINGVTVHTNNGSIYVISGEGASASSGTGGNGGSITGFDLTAAGSGASISLVTGEGGSGDKAGGSGGSAGAAKGLGVAFATGALSVETGNGGDSLSNAGSGGSIGYSSFGSATGVTLHAGDGGNMTSAVANNLNLAIGGGISNVVVNSISCPVSVDTGTGGHGPIGRHGGDITGLTVNGASTLGITTGDGANSTLNGGGTSVADGGRGGDISKLAIARTTGAVTIDLGDGGDGTKSGGRGGSLSNLANQKLTLLTSGALVIDGGDGGDSTTMAGVGGAGGGLSNLKLAVGGGLAINTNGGGLGGSGLRSGGAGGTLSGLAIFGLGGIGDVRAGDGGAATDVAGALLGGAGGSITGISVSGIGNGAVMRDLVAGDGGAAAGNGNGGVGGSVGSKAGNILVQGTIGDPTKVFGPFSQGGVFAGIGGAGHVAGINGNITNVRADGICSLLAGTGSVPKEVNLIDRVAASWIGADVDGDGKFDFHPASEGDAFTPTDTFTDGLVMATNAPAGTAFRSLNGEARNPLFKLIAGVATGIADPV